MIDSGAEIDEKTELDFYLKYMFAVEQGVPVNMKCKKMIKENVNF